MTDDELLEKYAYPSQVYPGFWWLTDPGHTKPAGELAAFIRAQLDLGVRVTDILEMGTWTALIDRLVRAEARIAALERGRSCGGGHP